jgi:HlyD family secretion protein
MKSGREPFGEENAPTFAGGFGPQGAALILELQRLGQAFDHELNASRPPPSPRPPIREHPPIRRTVAQQKRPKGKMRRIFDGYLERLGLGGRADVSRPPPRPGVVTAPRKSSPSLAPDSAFAMEPPRPAPKRRQSGDRDQLIHIDTPRLTLAPPLPGGNTAPPDFWPAKCRAGLSKSVGFLLGRDELAHGDHPLDQSLAPRVGRAFERELRTGLRVLIIAGAVGGGSAGLIPLAGAVVVPGSLVVQSNLKAIQHPTGGVVAEIPVHNGMRVAVGDLLLRLDATQSRASLQMVSKQLDEVRARLARLVAERDGVDRLEKPDAMSTRPADPGLMALLASEETQFRARRNARQSQKDLLQSRVGQLGEEISGLESQLQSKAKQLDLIAGELTGVQDLFDKRLVPITRLTTLQREAARIDGERGQMISAIAETKAKIGEAQLQIVRIDNDFRADVAKELGENRSKEAELVERGVAAKDQLDRIEIRAPTSGVVHQLAAHTVGGVIRAGDTVMEIVPDADDLQVEARLQPADIDQVRIGQKAFVRFSAFNQRTTPQLTGTVFYVAADLSHDPQTNAPYFAVRTALPDEERRRLGGLQLSSGMPAEIFMQTGSRTMLSYLLKPIADQWQRAFIER